MSKIPLLDLQPEIQPYMQEYLDAFRQVLDRGQFIMGPNVAAFEAEVAAYLGVKHAIAMNSGTDALVLGLKALGIKDGDEVITCPFTFFATAEAISNCNAVPVFVDIEPISFNIDPVKIEAAITPKTRAIIPVHLYGHSAQMDEILEIAKRRGIAVLEDVAQAFGTEYKGRKVGTLGHAGAFSFFPSKNLGAFGDAGMMTTDNDEVAAQAKMLRVHGAKKKYYNEVIGYNSRMDELHAALLRVKLPHIDQANEGRRQAADRYDELFQDVRGIVAPSAADYTRHVYHQYTIRVKNGRRDAVQEALTADGIGSFIYYPHALHTLPVYSNLPHPDLTHSEQATQEVLSLPIWPTISATDQERVARVVVSAVGELAAV